MAERARLALRPRDAGLKKNLLFHCDNLYCIDYLQKHGFENKIDLVYIDPPFLSGERYFRRIDNNSSIAFEDLWKHDK